MNWFTTLIQNLIVFLMTAAITSGCAVSQEAIETVKPPLGDRGELYFYLQPLPQEVEPLSFTISQIDVVPENGEPVSLLDRQVTIRGKEFVGRQKRLAVKILPPGRYKRIDLTLDQATIATEEGDMGLLTPAEPIRLELDFSIYRNKALALFLALSPEYLVTDGFSFTPRFAVGKPYLPPKNYMGFISHSSENFLSVFNKRTMEIVNVVHTGTEPKGLALDQEQGIVYVADSGDDTIEVVSLTTMDTIGIIKLRFGDQPTELALTPDGTTLIATNAGSATVSLVDTNSMSERERLRLDPEPEWVQIDEAGEIAYVLHPMTNAVSVIDIPRGRLFNSLSIDEAPERSALSRNGDSLYVISKYTSEISVVDTRSLAVIKRIFVGGGSSSVLVDTKNNLIYVGKYSGEIVVVDPTAGMFLDSFAAERGVQYLAIDGEENVLLVLSDGRNSLQAFNLISKRKQAEIEIEEGAYALVVMGEL